jgi:hypothetical protein
MSSLINAIQLIREGRKEEARQILETLLKAGPNNIQVWFWYVEVCSTLEKRIQVLETCLKMNPGNSQVIQALQTLRSQSGPQPSLTRPASSPKPLESQSPQPVSQYSTEYNEELNNPIYFDDSPTYSPELLNTTQEQSTGKKKKTWDEDYTAYEDTPMLSKSKPERLSYSFHEVWISALSMIRMDAYVKMLDDPEAGAGRAFEWMAYSGIISGLIFPLLIFTNPQFAQLRSMPEFSGLFTNIGTTAFLIMFALIMALLMPVFSVIGLAINAGIQNILAGFMGGIGDYGRTSYALAAYMAPMTIISMGLMVIPVLGQCLSSMLGIYNIVLNIRALQASHSLSVGQALGVIFAPAILIMILGCVFVLFIGLPGLSNLK